MPRSTRAARLTRSAARLRRIAAKVRPAGAPGLEHEHRRRVLSGRTVLASAERPAGWFHRVPPGPEVTGPASLNSNHPSHPYRPTPIRATPVDLTVPPTWSQELYRAVPKASGLRRWHRRQLARDLRGVGQHVQVAAPDSWHPRTLTTEAKPVDRATRRAQARADLRDAKKQHRADNRVPKAIDNARASRAVVRWVERQAPDSRLVADVKAKHSTAVEAIRAAAAQRQADRLSRTASR